MKSSLKQVFLNLPKHKLNKISFLKNLVKTNYRSFALLNKDGNDCTSKCDYDESSGQLRSVDEVLKKYIPKEVYADVAKIVYGSTPQNLEINKEAKQYSSENNFEIGAYKIHAPLEQRREPRITRVGAIQTKFPASTSLPINDQLKINFQRYASIIKGAHLMGVKVLCLQETWTAPFFFCTRENYPWIEFSESALHGDSTRFLKELALKYNMVIVSPILERDDVKDTIYNSAVIIDNHGTVIGKHHKVHIPRVGDFNESTYYMEGNLGCTVFETEFGRIGVNICYGRHHPLHWLAYGINGAEIVFNPSATVNSLSETMWPIEARNASIANNFYSVAINRVGTEQFPNAFTSGDGKDSHTNFGHFYGSSYVTAPDGSRTPGLSRTNDGLLVTEVDLNLCRQVKDKWKFAMTGRHGMYGKLLSDYANPEFKPDVIKMKPVKAKDEKNELI